jgi:hypothetical protein
VSIVNGVESLYIRSGKTPYANLLIIFGCPDLSRLRFMLFHTALGYDVQFVLRRFLEL